MKTRLLTALVALLGIAAVACAQTPPPDKDQLQVTFKAGTNIQSEIAAANTFLASLPTTTTIENGDDNGGGDDNGNGGGSGSANITVTLHLSQDDAAAVAALVNTYFPADPNVVSVTFLWDGSPIPPTPSNQEVKVLFKQGTDVATEITNANTFLVGLPTTTTIGSEYDTEDDGSVILRLSQPDAAAVQALVTTYFPADANVVSVNFVFEEGGDSGDEMSNMSESASSVKAGAVVKGSILLTKPAPKGGAKIALSIAGSGAKVPYLVVVPQGKIRAFFAITTNPNIKRTSTVRIIANYKQRILIDNLRINK